MEVRRLKPKPKINPLDKKIKPNPRYSKVENVVDTGNNLRKELERLEEVHQFYKFRHDEVFRRVNINNLVSLIVEQTKLEYQLNPPLSQNNVEEEMADENDNNSEFNDSAVDELEFEVNDENFTKVTDEEDIRSVIHSSYDATARHIKVTSRQLSTRSVTSLAVGFGEMDADVLEDNSSESDMNLITQRPFLILDVRDPDLYIKSHLAYSNSYQHTRLNRAFDYETSDMLRLKNKAGMIIVLYDDDESIASKCATTLTQRGYDNIFMLSGGLRVAKIKYPESLLITGDSSMQRLDAGDLLVLDRSLEENIKNGDSRSSRVGSVRSSRLSRSSSVGSCIKDNGNRRWVNIDLPVRTSTALAKKFR